MISRKQLELSMGEIDCMFEGDEYGIEHLLIIKQYIKGLQKDSFQHIKTMAMYNTLSEISATHTHKLNKITAYVYEQLVDLDKKHAWEVSDSVKSKIYNEIYAMLKEEYGNKRK